jgi:hypothetical protein
MIHREKKDQEKGEEDGPACDRRGGGVGLNKDNSKNAGGIFLSILSTCLTEPGNSAPAYREY